MKLEIITLDEPQKTKEYECKNFEFRSNQVNNWIRLKTDKGDILIHRVAVIKTFDN